MKEGVPEKSNNIWEIKNKCTMPAYYTVPNKLLDKPETWWL